MAYAWRQATGTAAFAPRDGAGALAFGGKMWLLGGWNPDIAYQDIFPRVCNSEVYSSADGVEWTLELEAAPWEGRHCAGYVVHDGKMWVVGGDVNQGQYQPDIWSSGNGIDWVCECEVAPWCTPERPRTMHQTVAFNGYIYVFGGQTMPKTVSTYHSHEFKLPDGEQIFYADCWRSADGRSWEKIAARTRAICRCV